MTDSDDFLASPDDAKLVSNEINRCLDEAGSRLHEAPREAYPSPVRIADYYLKRVQLLDRLGTRRAAAYLRKELLDAFASARDDDAIRRAAPATTPLFPGLVTTTQPNYWLVTDNQSPVASMYADIVNMSARYSFQRGYGAEWTT